MNDVISARLRSVLSRQAIEIFIGTKTGEFPNRINIVHDWNKIAVITVAI
jgi:hypothetical protein